MCNAQIVKHVRVVLFPFRRLAILSNRLTVLTQPRVSLSEGVMSLGVVRVLSQILFISLNRLFILFFGLFLFSQRLITQRQTEMRLGQLWIQPHSLSERLHCLRVLIVLVQLLAFVQQTTSPGTISR